MDNAADDFDLVDLSDLGLENLRELEDSVFAHSLRRILTEIDQPGDAVAKWNSAM